MSADRLQSYLDQMLQVASETIDFVRGATRESFSQDILTQRAVGMNLLMIGEMAVRILEEHPDFALRFDGVPWRTIRGMRNRIAHGYLSMNLDTVWDTAVNEVPILADQLHAIRHWRAQGE